MNDCLSYDSIYTVQRVKSFTVCFIGDDLDMAPSTKRFHGHFNENDIGPYVTIHAHRTTGHTAPADTRQVEQM